MYVGQRLRINDCFNIVYTLLYAVMLIFKIKEYEHSLRIAR